LPNPEFIALNSRFFENLLEHRFAFDLARQLVLSEKPRLLNIMRSEVDAFGVDLVLSVAGTSRHVQMKTRSGSPPANAYAISEAIWSIANGCVVWMRYDPTSLEPTSYNLFGLPLPPMGDYKLADRSGFRMVKMQQANHRNLSIANLAKVMFS
jgi:hypothetical protein